MVRLQRVLADAGVAARRVCEKMIEDGRVQVNGKTVTRLPVFVNPEADTIVADGRPVRLTPEGGPRGATQSRHAYLVLHKPERVMTTTKDEGGRTTVADLVKWPGPQRIYPVGRLDFHASGMVLLTSDGDLAHRLTHARYGVPKTYLLHIRGGAAPDQIEKINKALGYRPPPPLPEGVAPDPDAPRPPAVITGRVLGAREDAPYEVQRAEGKSKTMVRVTLTPQRFLNLPDLFLTVGLSVTKIVQTGIGGRGGVELGRLPVGAWRELEREEVLALRRAAGLVDESRRGPRGGRTGAGPRTIAPKAAPPKPAKRVEPVEPEAEEPEF
jgi:23S rRNA pseudouridine2605 synthase